VSERAQQLAHRVEQATNALIAAVEQCADADWQKPSTPDGRPVGVLAHHVAKTHADVVGLAGMIAASQALPPLTWEMTHQLNAEHAQQHANCTKQETLDLLRQNGVAAANIIRQMTDYQLDRISTWPVDGTLSTQQMIEFHIIEHVQEHLASINTVTGA
jgi:hypothetical protein